MAGSSTQSVENFTPQGMERHQIMMNTEVMKHFRIMNRASVREIMLQHEKTFKEQVHDLHKLYEVQKLLMEKAKTRGADGYAGAPPPPPPPPPGRGNTLSEDTNQLGQRRNFWEHVTPDSMGCVKGAMATHHLPSSEKAFQEKNIKFEDTSKNSSSPVRKRKIDLEQLPQDDSEDEMETSADALNSSLSGNSRDFTHGHSGPESMIKSHPSPCPSAALKPLQPVKELQLTGESSLYKNHIDGSGRGSFYPFQHDKAPSLPMNIVKAEQNLSNIGEINMSFQNACMTNTGVGTIKSNTMFLPQADLIDRASQEAGREAHWFFQAAEANAANRSSKSPLQQQRLPPHVAVPELSTGRTHPHNGVLQGSPNLEQRHHNNPSPPLGSVSVGDWSKAPVEKQLPGLLVGAQKDRPLSSLERLGDASRWLAKEPFSQSPLASVVPMARIETRASEGGPAMPGVVAPAITVSSNKGLSQERDLNMWSSQNPILQHPQYQQQPIFQPQVFPSVNQAVWLQQPSQTTQNSMYSQQMLYGVHSSDSLGYRNESLQRNQGEIGGPWNMIGLGHYYSSVPSTPQKPPFKKPPKLILKNDGVGMELKLVSPEKEMSEKASQKKPLNFVKKDPPQDISKSVEKKIAVHKEVKDEDQKLDKRASLGVQVVSSVGQGREPSKTSGGVPLEPKLLVTATSSLTQETILPKESSLLHDATSTVALSSITQSNVGTTHSVFAAGVIVSASPDKQKSQPHVSLPTRGHEKQSFPSFESTKATCVNEPSPSTDRGIDADTPDQKAESSLLQCKDDIGLGHRIMRDQKALSAKVLTSEANAKDVVATSQPESSSVAPEDAPLKIREESVLVANTSQKRVQKFDANHCKEAERPKGSHSTPSADSPSKDASYLKGLSQGRSGGHSVDLANPSCQPTMQAVSIQSNTPATPPSDRDCSSARSSTSLIPESKPEAKAGVSSDDLHLDFDNDNLAASILLSFAPKIDLPNEEKHAKSDACAVSSSSRKDRPADQASSSSRKDRPTDEASSKTSQGATGLRTQTLNSGGSQGRRIQGQGSFKRSDRMRHNEPIKSTMKDRLRTDEGSIDELETDNGGEDAKKGLMIKLPRVMGMSNGGETIPISRSKQLSKLNGVTPSGDSGDRTNKTFMASDTFHTPTGRRSSRGPPMAARILHASGSRATQQQTRHRLEVSSNTTEKDSGSREEAAGTRNKAEGNMKSKAWGELNKTRSHPRKQFQETSHRKTQR